MLKLEIPRKADRQSIDVASAGLCGDSETFPTYAWFMDTGTGKTYGATGYSENTQIKWFVVCPKNIIKTAWMADQQKFSRVSSHTPVYEH